MNFCTVCCEYLYWFFCELLYLLWVSELLYWIYLWTTVFWTSCCQLVLSHELLDSMWTSVLIIVWTTMFRTSKWQIFLSCKLLYQFFYDFVSEMQNSIFLWTDLFVTELIVFVNWFFLDVIMLDRLCFLFIPDYYYKVSIQLL